MACKSPRCGRDHLSCWLHYPRLRSGRPAIITVLSPGFMPPLSGSVSRTTAPVSLVRGPRKPCTGFRSLNHRTETSSRQNLLSDSVHRQPGPFASRPPVFLLSAVVGCARLPKGTMYFSPGRELAGYSDAFSGLWPDRVVDLSRGRSTRHCLGRARDRRLLSLLPECVTFLAEAGPRPSARTGTNDGEVCTLRQFKKPPPV